MDSNSAGLPGVSMKEALSTAKANDVARVLGRGEPNRIEPECWPVVKPGFEFSKDQKFFTIGSCFAGNIGQRLLVDGYNVHTKGEQRTRYTPPAILQEIEWAGRIFHRDGVVTREDVEPLLIETAPGLFSDLWNRPGKDPAVDLETAIGRRRKIYDWLSGAYEADVIVITLGLIEAWYDTASGSYVEFDGAWLRRKDRDRFRFEVLSFEKCKAAVRKTLGLLLDGKRRVLMTTSPVVLARTFTNKDIIVANNHSKSVLRAVAGELTDEFDDVDYFPSYEIATISGRNQVWEDDLRHVKSNFVARIMQHVTNAYVPGSVSDVASDLMHMANLVDAGEMESASAIFDRCTDAAERSEDFHIHAAAMRLARSRGDVASAARHALRFDATNERLYLTHPQWMFEAARALSSSEEHAAQSATIVDRLKTVALSTPRIILPFLVNVDRARDEEGIRFVAEIVEESETVEPAVVHRTAAALAKMGESDRALGLLRTQLRRRPDDQLLLAQYARMMLRDERSQEALEPLRTLVKLQPESEWANLALARAALAHSSPEEALQAVEQHLEAKPGDVKGFTLRARILSRIGRKDEARASAEAAASACGGDPRIMRGLQPLLATTS